MGSLRNLLDAVQNHLRLAFAGAIAIFATAALGVMRHEVSGFVKWAVSPITRRMPWNIPDIPAETIDRDDASCELISELSIVDIFLIDREGKFANYQKTSHYVVNAFELSGYSEGVTAAGHADHFSTLFGIIKDIKKEHGFYVCRIDFGDLYLKGYRFTNVFKANLYDTFTGNDEHWTQEIAFPTGHLTIRIHFRHDRRPSTLRCKVVDGLSSKQVRTEAVLTESVEEYCAIWEIDAPVLGDVFELEWLW